jgi:hypothetical protein
VHFYASTLTWTAAISRLRKSGSVRALPRHHARPLCQRRSVQLGPVGVRPQYQAVSMGCLSLTDNLFALTCPSNQSTRLTAGMLVARNTLCVTCSRSSNGDWPWLSVHIAWAMQIRCGLCSSQRLLGDTGPGSGNCTLPAGTTWLPCHTQPLQKHCTCLHGCGIYMW